MEVAMRVWSMGGFALLWAGCSEYDVTAKAEAAPGPGASATDTAEPPASDTGSAEPPPDANDTGETPVEDPPPDDPPPDDPPDDDPPDDDPPEDDPPTDTAEPCTEVVTAFDIEELSVLQDAASPFLVWNRSIFHIHNPWYRDALILSYTPPADIPDLSWRVSAVEVLIMVATERFETHPDGETLSVEVFDGDDPRTDPTWKVSQPVVHADLTWADYTLPADAAVSGDVGEFEQKGAWLRFDFRSTIPDVGMHFTDFVVGVQWEDMSQVAVGYSNFNRRCDLNWTEWEPGSGWVLNGTTEMGDVCSWPMMRVEIERIHAGDCE
jgi:hypothetical protein